jgi:hypothetical protein
MEELKRIILQEAANVNKLKELNYESGNYMAWQKLMSREHALLWVIQQINKGGKHNGDSTK